ncbi:probable E3 ubiquitin-protein ligase DTX3 [Trichomycterus rosablanca]|uniref:probable E3 ubiquitin-protein ligase DTX3 n=1 Tax=Trichomycterus rosablanca TaxID=2290929 RepID=UPI002F35A099
MEQTSHIIGQNEVSESEPRFQISSGGNQDLLCSVCKADHSTVKQKSCGYKFCSQCEKESHTSCKICSQASNQDTVGIKGSVFIRESTVTIPGFIRDTTLRLIYDIPDGIQGDDHPCPGAPFKGGKFQAFLPYNEDTKRLLPLLEKAFFKGHTFTVQVKRSRCKGKNESREGKVVWGSIPHKTSTDGGMSKNGYPDSSFIKRLTKALKAAGIEE